MALELPPLPYAYDALEPFIDTMTMQVHHGKHHATYFANLNAALEPYPELQKKPIEDLLKNLAQVPEAARTAVKNNGGGHANHTMFWLSMAPKAGGEPTGPLADAIKASFGSFDAFKAEFKNTAWDGIFAGLAAGKYDAISSSVSITEERKATMDFSDPIMAIEQMLVVAKADKATDLAGLKGKTIGAQIGTTSYLVIKDVKGFKAIKTYDEVGLAMEDLVKGSIQAVVADSPVAVEYTTKKHADKIKIAATLKSDKVENIGIAAKKGNKEVIDLVNKGLAAIKADGTFDKIKAAHQMK